MKLYFCFILISSKISGYNFMIMLEDTKMTVGRACWAVEMACRTVGRAGWTVERACRAVSWS